MKKRDCGGAGRGVRWVMGGIGLYIGVACKRSSEDVDSESFTNMVMFAINKVCIVWSTINSSES